MWGVAFVPSQLNFPAMNEASCGECACSTLVGRRRLIDMRALFFSSPSSLSSRFSRVFGGCGLSVSVFVVVRWEEA